MPRPPSGSSKPKKAPHKKDRGSKSNSRNPNQTSRGGSVSKGAPLKPKRPLPKPVLRQTPSDPPHPDPLSLGPGPELDPDQDLIFGRQAVLAALEAQRTLNKIWIIPQLRYNSKFLPLLQEAKQRGAVIDEVSPQRLKHLTEGGNHQGIAAQGTAYNYIELETLIDEAFQQTVKPVLIVLDGVQDPHNLGAIARTAEAFGIQGIIIPQRRAVGVTSTVLKVAAGALTTLPIARVVNLNRALSYLKEKQFWVYGTDSRGNQPIHTIEFEGPVVLVIGSEGDGISLLTQQHCDYLISIPLIGRTESLNASVAAGISMYEIFRQRALKILEWSDQGSS